MALSIGSRLGPYQILSAIGSGGMGEVYKATDTRLNRLVAIKVLPDVFAADQERLARFQREAQVLASLNHPHIGAIHGLEESDGVRALVLELVDGPTIADRIAQGPLPLHEALRISQQIAAALEVAHEHGIVHRDLKPANIKLTPDGIVKVLDFGLAKPLDPVASTPDASRSPTLMSPAATRAGVILGTAAYMSPEQARGNPLDKRTDIWAFGCVLYEMLTGRRAFGGEEIADVLARIIEREPDFSALPSSTPPAIRRLLRRCLEKDRKRRWSDIADARIEIDETLAAPTAIESATAAPSATPQRWSLAVAFVLGVSAAIIGVGAFRWGALAPVSPQPMRFAITPPPTDPLFSGAVGAELAISPDGRELIYEGVGAGSQRLYARPIDQLDARPIAGTEGGRQPFLSPDGASLGFWMPAEGALKRMVINGGPAATICKAPSGNLYGASWGPDGTIVFASGGLYRVSAAGGAPEQLSTPAAERGEAEYRWPEILPDGETVVFTIWGGSIDRARIAVRSLKSGEQKVIAEGASSAHFASGHLVYNQGGSLMAAAFDPARLEVAANRLTLQQRVETKATGSAAFTLARSGALVFIAGTARPERRLIWVDHEGRASPLIDAPDDYWLPRLSPDGTRLAVGITNDIWVIELARLTRTRVTFGLTSSLFPFAWSTNGDRITFSKVENKVGLDIYSTAADGSSQPELVVNGEYRQWATSWSADGRVLAFYEQNPTTVRDIWMFSRDGGRTKFLATPFSERSARFSPDGRWLMYVSNESGRDEVYLRPYPAGVPKVTVSTQGGTEPVWSGSGREIFYRNERKVMVTSVETRPTLTVGRPRVLFEADYERDRGAAQSNPTYDVTPDGRRFVMVQAPLASSSMVVVLNWLEELTERQPAAK